MQKKTEMHSRFSLTIHNLRGDRIKDKNSAIFITIFR
jgi:hypothetical protein